MSKIIDDFRIALESILRRKTRSFLTILAIVIGIASVVALIGIGNGLQNTMNEQFERMGTDKIFVMPSGGVYGIGSTVALNEDDLNVIENVRGVQRADGWPYKLARMEYNDMLVYNWVMGPDSKETDYETLVTSFGLELTEGKAPGANDRYKAIVGCMLAHDENNIFGKLLGIGKKFTIEGQEFEVSGVVSCVGNPNDDQQVYINADTLFELFNVEEKSYDMIIIMLDKNVNVSTVAEEITKDLRDLRNLDEGEEDFSVQTAEQLVSTFMSVFSLVVIVIGGIGAISLLVGGVGIANTMFTSVLERTREIGAMKAVGATNTDILSIIVWESGLFGLIGGSIGVTIGYAVAKLVGIVATNVLKYTFTVRFSPGFLIGMLVFAFVLGVISGAIPAYRASKMNPVEALRYE
ncbi:MAG: ABC transporter permease [Candidatus Nanoarchaeia archaeon]|nr:ABC transporter permease [Candidatus Nanoarchaeia archaeon]MDD5239854.1 ABC transporter permease [Candidatus Nanoarchaeia archaeon]